MRNILLITLLEKYPKEKEIIEKRLRDSEWLHSHWVTKEGREVHQVPFGGLYYEQTDEPYEGSLLHLKPVSLTDEQIKYKIKIEVEIKEELKPKEEQKKKMKKEESI